MIRYGECTRETGTTPKSLLSHIAICDQCGHPLHRVLRPKNGDAPRRVGYHCQFRGCFKTTILAEPLDKYVTDYAISWLSEPENVMLLAGEDENWVAHAETTRREKEVLEKRLEEATELAAQGQIPLPTLTRIERALRPQIEAAEQQLALPIADRSLRELINSDDMAAAWNDRDFAEQRRILKSLFEIRVTKAPRRGRQGFQPGRVLITPRPQGGEARAEDVVGAEPLPGHPRA